MNVWDNPTALDELERRRDRLRTVGKKMTFDCLNNQVINGRVFCKKGKSLSQATDSSMALISVLRGMTSGVCRNCKEFVQED